MQKRLTTYMYTTGTDGKILPLLQLTSPICTPTQAAGKPQISPYPPRILFLFDFLGKGKGTSSAWLKDREGFGLQTRYYCITHPPRPPTSLRAALTIQAREREKRGGAGRGSLSFILQMSKALNFSTFDLGEPFLLSITSSGLLLLAFSSLKYILRASEFGWKKSYKDKLHFFAAL